MHIDDYLQSTYEVFPDKGMQNTRICLSNIGDINNYKSFKSYNAPQTMTNLTGAGTGGNSKQAAFLSKMEAIERLCNSIPVSNLIIDTRENLGDKAIDLSLFPKLANYEIGFNRNYKNNEVMKWIKSINITTNDIKYIPQGYIHLFTEKEFNGERITNPISTGCAIHTNYADAILNGIYEVVERDSIALTWLLKVPMEQLNIEPFRHELNVFDNDFLGEIKVYDASTIKGLHTFCMRAITHHAESVKNVLMYSTHINSYTAIGKLKKELLSVLYSLLTEANRNPDIIKKDYTQFFGVSESALYMSHPNNHREFKFLDHTKIKEFPKETIAFKNKNEELRFIIKLLKEQGHEVYVTDLTNRECIENHLKAVKVTIPTLQPISFVHQSRYLDSNRIRTYAEDLYGIYREDMINHSPLPFS
jgi:ribosomal protein S12 methylthiotransferase accessory factor